MKKIFMMCTLMLCMFLSACSKTVANFQFTGTGIGFTTAKYRIHFERFDTAQPTDIRCQLTIEPTIPDAGLKLPPISVDVQPTPTGGKVVDIIYDGTASTTRGMADFQVGLNGCSYTGQNHRVELKYVPRTDGKQQIKVSVDPLTMEAKHLPPANVTYTPTSTGGVVVVFSWTPSEALVRSIR